MRIGEARMLTPESFDLDGVRPFVRILSEKVHARRGRPPKDEVRLVPLTDISYVRQMESWMITTRPRRREPLWAVTDETMRNWLKQAVKRAEADGVTFRFRSHHTPSGTAISCTCSITASPGKSSRHWLVTEIHIRWRFIPECLHWIWLPRWQCLSQVTGGMLRRSCVHSLP
ncbi:recombinase [Escherichia coli]|nr:recombinase [Escherichia coli]